MTLYFAYGSNMLFARLAARCPGLRKVGVAYAQGYELAFIKNGRDGSGKATLITAAQPGWQQPGVLYDVPDNEMATLDEIEGAGFGYERRDDFTILTAEGTAVTATTYLALDTSEDQMPFDWYRDLVLEGARENGFPDPILQLLHAQPVMEDPIADRPGRLAALEALCRKHELTNAALCGNASPSV